MRALWFVALFAGLVTSFSKGQEAVPSGLPHMPDAQPARVKVYAVGPGVTAPELLPLNLAPIPAEKCKKKVDGKVVLSVLVDESGQPRNIVFLKPLGSDLDKLALKLVAADRFKPGTSDGKPVVVAQSVEVDFQACIDEINNDAGKKASWLRLRAQPEQKLGMLPQPLDEIVLASGNRGITRVGGGVSAPVVIHSIEPKFSDEATRSNIGGVCIVTLIVDAHGMPQNVRVTQKLGYGLDEKAIEAVNHFRFKPAVKDGEPVEVKVSIEINFHF